MSCLVKYVCIIYKTQVYILLQFYCFPVYNSSYKNHISVSLTKTALFFSYFRFISASRSIRIRIIRLVIWLNQLIERGNSHSFETAFLGTATKLDLLRSSSMSPLSYISFITSMILSLPKSSKAENFSGMISFGPAAFFC